MAMPYSLRWPDAYAASGTDSKGIGSLAPRPRDGGPPAVPALGAASSATAGNSTGVACAQRATNGIASDVKMRVMSILQCPHVPVLETGDRKILDGFVGG